MVGDWRASTFTQTAPDRTRVYLEPLNCGKNIVYVGSGSDRSLFLQGPGTGALDSKYEKRSSDGAFKRSVEHKHVFRRFVL